MNGIKVVYAKVTLPEYLWLMCFVVLQLFSSRINMRHQGNIEASRITRATFEGKMVSRCCVFVGLLFRILLSLWRKEKAKQCCFTSGLEDGIYAKVGSK